MAREDLSQLLRKVPINPVQYNSDILNLTLRYLQIDTVETGFYRLILLLHSSNSPAFPAYIRCHCTAVVGGCFSVLGIVTFEAGRHIGRTMDDGSFGLNQILMIAGLVLLTVNGLLSLPLGGFLILWYISILFLDRTGYLERWNCTRVLGIILMIRTNKGKDTADFIARPRRFWRIFGEASIWLCFAVMLFLIFGIAASAISTAVEPAQQEVLPATDILFIPGVTSFVPIFWPILALIVAVVVHEYGHGLMARAHGMRIRSFGILMAGIIPVGAFYEPDQEEMRIAPQRDRLRMFAAGPSVNIVMTYFVVILLAVVSSGLTAKQDGVYAVGIVEGSGADEAGLLPYELISEIDGVAIATGDDLTGILNQHDSGDLITMLVSSNPIHGDVVFREVDVTLTDKKDYYYQLCDGDSQCESNVDGAGIEQGDAFLGVSGIRSADSAAKVYGLPISEDLSFGERFVQTAISPLLFSGVPIQNQGQTMVLEERAFLGAGTGILPSLLGIDVILGLFDFLFWIMWISFLLGVANLIPLIPFDGGHMVRNAGHIIAKTVLPKSNPLKIERIADQISSYSSLFVLALVLIPILLPRFF